MSETREKFVEFALDYRDRLKEVLDRETLVQLDQAHDLILDAFRQGRKVFVAGNGGSAATASHMACDFQKTTLGKSHGAMKVRIKAIALSDNAPLMTAWGNDVSYDHVFSQQLVNLSDPGDVLIVISASGNSPNIVEALDAAKKLDLVTIGLLGFEGGKSKDLCNCAVIARSTDYGVIEDAHSVFMHMLTASLRDHVFAHNEVRREQTASAL